MYFWRIEGLKAELRQGTLSQRQQFYYYYAQSILLAVVLIPLPSANKYDVVSGFASLFITLIGVVFLYRWNAGDRGTLFLERVFSIGFVVGIRLFVLLGLPFLVLYIFVLEKFLEVPADTTLTDVVVFALFEIIFIWRIGVHLRQVAVSSVA